LKKKKNKITGKNTSWGDKEGLGGARVDSGGRAILGKVITAERKVAGFRRENQWEFGIKVEQRGRDTITSQPSFSVKVRKKKEEKSRFDLGSFRGESKTNLLSRKLRQFQTKTAKRRLGLVHENSISKTLAGTGSRRNREARGNGQRGEKKG